MDTCYDNGINARKSPSDVDDADEPIAVSTGIIDDMGFEHLEIVESPKWMRKKGKEKRGNLSSPKEASSDGARLSASTSPKNTLSPLCASPASPASPPNTPAITGPRTFSTDATLSCLETALSGVAGRAEDEHETLVTNSENNFATDANSGANSLDSHMLGAVGGAPRTLASTIYPNLDEDDKEDVCKKESDAKHRDICCICMESEAVVILPCYHSFCETCIDSWVASRRSTCPLCRRKMGTRNDRWEVIEELPVDFDVKTEIGKVLLHMAELCGKNFEE